MKNAFTIVEVSILFVIFLIVAFLVAPLSLDDTLQAKNTARWRAVQGDFENIMYSVKTQNKYQDKNTEEGNENNNNSDVEQQVNKDKIILFNEAFNKVMKNETKSDIEPYKITYMNGSLPGDKYDFTDLKQTYSNAVVSYKLSGEGENGILGVLMYDVNGEVGPNVWGKDIYGLNIYTDHFEPFCKNDTVAAQKKDCSSSGTGLCCSNYYLIGGSLN